MLVNGNGEKNGQCVVSPSRDIFCLAARDWNIDPGSSEAWQMFIKDIDVPSDMSRLPNIPKSSHPKRYCRIVNIALEFDPLWVVDFPETYEDLMKEASPRGFLSRLMYYRFDGNEPGFKVWLIDKDTQWSWNPNWGIHQELRPDQTIEFPVDRFSDYNGDYMEANLALRCEFCTNERSGILAEFLEKVCCLGDDCKDINDNGDPSELFWATTIYDINQQAKLLVRPGNQVELCNKDHRQVPSPQDSDLDSDMGF
ncbi:hypothetical protein LB507_004170 [Fusarium sp. FIESC RH6]|nr:hypothetical protein LB507_004170 [Fusarium sp. FIESC RH6]